MKKEIWQDALNQMDEKWAAEYAEILKKEGGSDAEKRMDAPVKKRAGISRRAGLLAAAACIGLLVVTAALSGLFRQPRLPAGSSPSQVGSLAPLSTEPGTMPSAASPSQTDSSAALTMPAAVAYEGQQYYSGNGAADAVDYFNTGGSFSYKHSLIAPPGSFGFYGADFWDTEEYSPIRENGFLSVKNSPFSTFAADVDTASYANLRRMIRNKQDIPADAVRIEELINYFHYNFAQPKEGEPFGVTLELSDCPWNAEAKLLLIGLQAKRLETEALPPSNLVFLIDVSGSMATPEKLPLVQRSFMTLAENLGEKDKITLITYSSGEKMLLDGVSGNQTARIMGALEELKAGGSTNGQQALKMAYKAAEKHFIPEGNNRIILATDGDFNVGITSEAELTRFVKEEAKKGVFLSVLGYGMGNYKDNKMEAMADNGNGNYYYIDNIAEARKVLVEEAGGTLFTVAKDVKLQVEFNPAQVKGYRLIGYENRVMAAEDFADDTKDGGELGAGHQVTALYEIIPAGSDFEIPEVESRYGQNEDASRGMLNGPGLPAANEWLVLNIRYKEPAGSESRLLSYPLPLDMFKTGGMSPAMQWASGIAQWGMLLRDSEYKGSTTYARLLEQMEGCKASGGPGLDDFRKECLELIRESSDFFAFRK